MPQLSRQGRKGNVFSIRLTPEERALVEQAHAKWSASGDHHWWSKPSLAQFVRETVLDRAHAVLAPAAKKRKGATAEARG